MTSAYLVPKVSSRLAPSLRFCSSIILDGERCRRPATHVSFGVDPDMTKKQNAHAYDCCASCAECEIANYGLPVIVSPFMRKRSLIATARALLAKIGGAS